MTFCVKDTVDVIGFDADDTLWVNEPYFKKAEKEYLELMHVFGVPEVISAKLHQTNVANLGFYGYGSRSFTLSLIETAIQLSDGHVSSSQIAGILDIGKRLLTRPIDLLDGVLPVLENLHGRYRLIVATKGDLLEQEQKLKKSSLERFFHHIEIMSDKNKADYEKLFRHLDISPEKFLMIGNSLKSDILPVLELGGFGIHVPYHTVWVHDHLEQEVDNPKFLRVESIHEILNTL